MTSTLIYTVLLACTLLVKRIRRTKQPRPLTNIRFSNLLKFFEMKNIYKILFFFLFFVVNAQAQTWKAQTLPGSDSLSISDISIVNDTVAWAATWNLDIADSSWNYNATGRVYRTINGGTTWTASTLPGTGGKIIPPGATRAVRGIVRGKISIPIRDVN